MNKKYLQLLEEGWEKGSSNTFADLGLENAEELHTKAYLRAAILARIAELKITQVEAARRTGIPQPRMSNLMNDTATKGFSSDKLLNFATKLGLNVELRVSTARSGVGKIIMKERPGRAKRRSSKSRQRTAA
jgi:predicted XRE-type DNA-binding protein